MVDMENLKQTIDHGEGLGWALDEYHPELIPDKGLQTLWADAREAMDTIRDYLAGDMPEVPRLPAPKKERDDPARENQSYRRKDGTWHAAIFKKGVF